MLNVSGLPSERLRGPPSGSGGVDDDTALYIAVGVIAALLVLLSATFIVKRQSYKRKHMKVIADYHDLLGFEFPKADEYEFDRRHVHYDLENSHFHLGKGQYGSVVRGECTVDLHTQSERISHVFGNAVTSVSNVVRRGRITKGARPTSTKDRLAVLNIPTHEASDATSRAEVAIKLCNASTLSAEEANAFLDEANVMKLFHHPHVAAIIGQVVTSQPLLLIVELLDCDLKAYLDRVKPKLSCDGSSLTRCMCTQEQINLCKQAASGLAAIAEKVSGQNH
jgi:hypothetical protein